jgi:D-arabinose 1-dehydrogenase-like Zn-dependent alcohol dehydrogenase
MASENRQNAAKTMRAAQVSKAGAPLEMVDLPIPEPGREQVRIKVQACGVCHSDSVTVQGLFPGISFPISPGHEVIGTVDKLGEDVDQWQVGQRVGLGWYGGHCGKCEPCRRGDLVLCRKMIIPGVAYSGGYAEYLVCPAEALAAVPESLSSAEGAPLLCAGITTLNALRNSGARAGDLVAILGIGGLGHLGVQFASKMGFETVAIARGADKASFAKQLGAEHYIDSNAGSIGEALQKLGGAKLILSTVTDAGTISAAAGGLGYNGKLVIVGIPAEPIQVSVGNLIMNRQTVSGWPSGTAIDSEDTLRFSALENVLPIIERYPLEKAPEAYERMMSGKARFRVVIEMGK